MIECAADFPMLTMFVVTFRATMADGRRGDRGVRCIGIDAPDALASLAAHMSTTLADLHVLDVHAVLDPDVHVCLNGRGSAQPAITGPSRP